jgi:hypothetical protein
LSFGSGAQKPPKAAAPPVAKVVKPPTPITVTLDGEPVAFEGAQPQTMMGRIMVPLRGVFEKMGCYVEYDAANHIITAHYQNQSVVIRMGDKVANKNGAEILMEVPATIINGNALVPLRFLAESMGAKVEWDEASKTVSIKTEDGD